MNKKKTIRIEFLEDVRIFKKGEVFEFDINPLGITYIAGNNGSGKSTLLQALRLQCDKLKEINEHRSDGIDSQILRNVTNDVLPKIKIDGFDYDEVYALDSIVDDPNALDNSITAWSFVAGGGYGCQRASKGEKAVFLLSKFIKDVKKEIEKIPKEDKFRKRRLFIIDEVDEGLDLRLQFKYNRILENKFNNEYFGDVLVVSHNIICMLSDCIFKPKVFNIDKKEMTTVEDYINEKTDGKYSIQIIKNTIDGSKQNN